MEQSDISQVNILLRFAQIFKDFCAAHRTSRNTLSFPEALAWCFFVALSVTPMMAATPGDPDPTFTASNARVLTTIGNSESKARKVMIAPDGKIIVAGKGVAINVFGDFAVLRYNPDGSLDQSFGAGGKTVVPVGIQDSTVLGAILQPDGKIVLVGEGRASNAASSDFAVVRFNSDGSLDQTFGSGGKVLTTFSETSFDYATSVAFQADNKLVVAGISGAVFAVARYNSDWFA